MKSNIKTILAILLSLAAILSLCACGAEPADSDSSKIVTSMADGVDSDVSTSESEILSETSSSVSSESSAVTSVSEVSSRLRVPRFLQRATLTVPISSG